MGEERGCARAEKGRHQLLPVINPVMEGKLGRAGCAAVSSLSHLWPRTMLGRHQHPRRSPGKKGTHELG